FYVIITPVIVTTMQRVMFMSEGNMTVADAFDRIDSVLDRKPFENADKNITPDDHSVAFENVSFSYDGEKLALDNVSFEAKSGTSLALVGPSGGGKTTVAGLIARFWDVQNGAVKIGGVNVKDIPKEELRFY
ncbi:MAG: ATP-binding cassette domain-containing protein, partial [Ruminococcus sp.]|nr:ATP-binding cassette domain-containing protein [Ruminococcus sp.]